MVKLLISGTVLFLMFLGVLEAFKAIKKALSGAETETAKRKLEKAAEAVKKKATKKKVAEAVKKKAAKKKGVKILDIE